AFDVVAGRSACQRQTGRPPASVFGALDLSGAAHVNASYFAGSRTAASVAGTRTLRAGLPLRSHFVPPSSNNSGWPCGKRHFSERGNSLTGSKIALASLKTRSEERRVGKECRS